MYKWVFSERLKLSGDEHHRFASGKVFQARGHGKCAIKVNNLLKQIQC